MSAEAIAETAGPSWGAGHRRTCRVKWVVNNFSLLTAGEDYFSPYVSSPEEPNLKWCIGLKVADEQVTCGLQSLSEQDVPEECSFQYVLSAGNSSGERVSEWSVASRVSPDSEPHSAIIHCIKFSSVMAALVDDDLVLEAEICFTLMPEGGGVGAGFVQQQHSGTGAGLLGDISGMLGDSTFSDVRIIVENSGVPISIPAHQILLATRSRYFHDRLTEGTEENRERCIRIQNSDVDTVRRMLAYIYADRFDDKLRPDEMIKLLKCADEYSLHGLKNLCELHLIRNINHIDLCTCLITADQCNAKQLRAMCLEEICRNATNLTRSISTFNSPQCGISQESRMCLLIEIICKLAVNLLPN